MGDASATNFAALGPNGARPGALLHPVAHLRWRLRRWWQARLRPSDSLTLTQRNVYILPTRPGFMLAATLLLLLLASINYQLNLGHLLTFLLAGSAIVGMHAGHNTLRGLILSTQPPQPQFAGSPVTIQVQLTNHRRATRHSVGLSVLQSGHWSWADVPGQSGAMVQLTWRPKRRGQHQLPVLTAETRFPLGTFRVWTIWQPACSVLVYPAPEPNAPAFPPGQPRSGAAARSVASGSGEYDQVRAYRRGDPMKLVVWKKFGKSDELVSRDTQQAQQHELWFDLTQTAGEQLDIEQQLARLCAWVLRAEEQEIRYGLRLPGLQIKPDSGPWQRQRCLQALALC